MAIAPKLLEINQVKQDIKQAIEDKGVAMSGVPFTNYPLKISEISGGGGMTYEDYARTLYLAWGKSNQFTTAWEHSLIVDPLEISVNSSPISPKGKAQYPNGETEGVIIPHGVAVIGTHAFRDWTSNNQPLVIPDSVTAIGDNAFQGWASNNQLIVIPNGVTSIGSNAFRNWSLNNQPLVIPNSVTSIAGNSFRDWTSNNQPLVISNSVTSIGDYAFSNWSSNNQPLVIPNSVTSIGQFAFNNWSNVIYVEMKSETPPILANTNAFDNQTDAPIYVPDASVTAYKNATNWSALSSRIFSINEK